MTELLKAAEGLERFLRPLEELFAIRDDLRRLGSAEQTLVEQRSRLDALAQEVAQADAALRAKAASAEQLMAEARAVRAQADEDAGRIIAAAKDEATILVEGAKDKAKAAAKAAKAKLEDLEEDIADAQARKDRAVADADDAEARFAEVRKKLDQIIQKIEA